MKWIIRRENKKKKYEGKGKNQYRKDNENYDKTRKGSMKKEIKTERINMDGSKNWMVL